MYSASLTRGFAPEPNAPRAVKSVIRQIESEPCGHPASAPQELGEQTMEMVHAAFAGGGVAAALVQARSHAALD